MPTLKTKPDYRPKHLSRRTAFEQRSDWDAWRHEQARSEYSEWLKRHDWGGADAYKEDPDRLRYTPGPNGGVERRSYTDWMDTKARQRYPEHLPKIKAGIRKRWKLRRYASLV